MKCDPYHIPDTFDRDTQTAQAALDNTIHNTVSDYRHHKNQACTERSPPPRWLRESVDMPSEDKYKNSIPLDDLLD